MEKVAAQVAAPSFIPQTLSSRFCETPAVAKKRDLSYGVSPNYLHQQLPNPNDNWNPRGWDWDTLRFLGKPLEPEILRLGTATATTTCTAAESAKKDEGSGIVTDFNKSCAANVEEDSLRLNLGSGLGLNTVEEPLSRPNKRVRSGSPGGSSSYPMCQVDNCKEDLSKAKDYHRRHKVCEVHSKSSKALVANQMQRFCQQCSRFHPLSEFDEGKRSCRRRLAGHNRRRRKTQPEDVTSRLLIPGNQDNATTGNLDIVNLLTAIAPAHGKFEERICSQLPDRDQLVQILNRINSIPLPADLAELPNGGNFNGKGHVHTYLDRHDKLNRNPSSPLTMDLLAVLSATLSASAPDAIALLTQKCSQSSDSEKSTTSGADQKPEPSLQRQPLEFTSVGGERSSSSYQSPVEDSDCQVQEAQINIPLQLFSSSPEDESLPTMASSQKYFSSDSSNPVEERSPSSSPPFVQKQFAMQGMAGGAKSEKITTGREVKANKEASQSHDCNISLDLFRGSKSNTIIHSSSLQSVPFQAGYISSGSDHSPSSLNSDAQDRTGRIMFKLFDKDPSHFPKTLRTQIYKWLSNSPSDMESYIRPGCVILSIYVSMSSATWEQLQENFLQHVHSLTQMSNSDFWRNGRFLVDAGSQLASHKDGKIRLCKPWRTCRAPELISVSPLAIVGGEETSISLKGRNLSTPGTKIHCTNMACYTSEEVIGSAYPGMTYDWIKLGGFKVYKDSPGVLGRCFIEVENGFKGNSFPLIIADATICKELRLLESEFDTESKVCDSTSEDHAYHFGRPRSSKEVLHFLNELGWLFQRRRSSYLREVPDFSLNRFKFLLTFAVERNCCMLVKTLLDMLVEKHLAGEWLSKESTEMLNAIQLLNRAVKGRFTNMVDMLLHYSIPSKNNVSRKFLFPPNLEGPGGITPLHLAACTSGSEGVIDSLTNDPQEIGLKCWGFLLDANGQTPHSYAMMRNNHSFNTLIARKLADRGNGQISVAIDNEIVQPSLRIEHKPRLSNQLKQGQHCTKCVVAAMHSKKRVPGSLGLLNRPYIHSVLAIAAVCVCVCLFLRGAPDIGFVAPFKWENLDFGTM